MVRDHKGNRPRDEVVHNPLKVEISAPMPLLKVEIEESPKVLARAHRAAAIPRTVLLSALDQNSASICNGAVQQ